MMVMVDIEAHDILLWLSGQLIAMALPKQIDLPLVVHLVIYKYRQSIDGTYSYIYPCVIVAETHLMPGQLDEISQAIGRLEGAVGGIEKYIHDKRHDDVNLAQKVEALGVRITRDIAAVEGRIEGRIKAMDDRLAAVEREHHRANGAKSLAVWLLRSPLIGWFAAALLVFAAWWKGAVK